MKLKNFSEKKQTKFYAYLNTENIIIYDEKFEADSTSNNIKGIFEIVNERYNDGIKYWKIKKKEAANHMGWVKSDGLDKFLNTLPQNINVFENLIDYSINEKLNIKFYPSEDILYTKSYLLIFNNKPFFGLSFNGDFKGFVNVEAINNGEIEPVNFSFNDSITTLYKMPTMNLSFPLHTYNKEFLCTNMFRVGDKIVGGFSFGEKFLWFDCSQTNIEPQKIKSSVSLDKNFYIKDYYINRVTVDPDEYYKVNDILGTTHKLENIISGFEMTHSGSRLYKKFTNKIGIICDEFMYNSLKDSADFEYIPFSEDISINKNFDLVLIVSSWKGIDGSWQYIANSNGHKRTVLNSLLNKYNQQGIPTVFYSKEDPVNYDRFISIAQNCQYIFTSAEEIIDKYIEDTGNGNVDYLEFSINPLYHNPIGKNLNDFDKQNQVIFAGSWMKKYPMRNKESAEIFKGVIDSDFELNIVDRNFDRELHDYQYPIEYLRFISKTIGHENLMRLHKSTTWGINLNSVKYSNTMFANRVYELQAMGNLIISNYSMGVNNKFPNINIVNDENDVKRILDSSTQESSKELIAKSISNVMLNNTAYHRIEKILTTLGFEKQLREPKILVIGESEDTLHSFNNQLYHNKEYLTLSEFEQNSFIEKEFDFISYFSSENIYEEYYLINLLATFAYTSADVVEMGGEKYNYKIDNDFNQFKSLIKSNNSIDNNNIFNIPETEIQMKENIYDKKEDKLLSVIIPIHNNGRYLEDKCFRSLKRSSVFDKMEIIMIDDGSSDLETIKIINRIRRRHPSIKYFRFEEGSGSASRPRNKGIEMVGTKYVTFLDPDNEASGDGYKLLLEELKKNSQLDLVVGNVLKENHIKKSLLNYYYYVKTYNDGEEIVSNPKQFLIESNLRAHSIQALIVKLDIIKNNNLRMIEGAAGQDTMFFQELLLYSNKFKAIPHLIHMYYAAVTGSVTTTIKKSFFEKYLILEKERVPFLKRHGLYEIYVNERFPYYFNNWYVKRLSKVPTHEYKEVIAILKEIFNMYKDEYRGRDSQLNTNISDMFGDNSYLNI